MCNAVLLIHVCTVKRSQSVQIYGDCCTLCHTGILANKCLSRDLSNETKSLDASLEDYLQTATIVTSSPSNTVYRDMVL